MWKRWCWGVLGVSTRLPAWTGLLLMLVVSRTAAIGDVDYRNPSERVLGLSPVASAFVFGTSRDAHERSVWMVESGERYLFGIAGLKTTYLRVTWDRQSSGLTFSSAFLSSPVGGEKYFTVQPFYRRGGRFVLSGTAGVSIASLDGSRSARLFTAGVGLVAAPSSAVAVGYREEGIRAAGEERPGVDMSLYVAGWRDLPASAVVGLRMDRGGEPGLVVASRLRLGRSLEVALGFDERTGTLGSSLSVGSRSVTVLAGAAHHPVLGVSKALFLRWGRGW